MARALYLEVQVSGALAAGWRIAWSNTACFIYVPPAFDNVWKDGSVRFVRRVRMPRASGCFALQRLWHNLHHFGKVPDNNERTGL